MRNKSSILFLTSCLWTLTSSYSFSGHGGAHFTCHCSNNDPCDVITGECPAGCATDSGLSWSGEGCQTGNVALGKTASQTGSSSHSADRAIDGEHGQAIWEECSEAERVSGDLWWRVDLGGTYVVTEVHIYLRSDTVAGGALIFISDSNYFTYDDLCGEVGGTTDVLSCTSPTVGQYITIQQPYTFIHTLSICEVSVIGYQYYKCSTSIFHYGPGCLLKCHCVYQCDWITGACDDDCHERYFKNDEHVCVLDLCRYDCTPGYRCHCLEPCDVNTGVCSHCQSGYKGSRCTESCDEGEWGEDCMNAYNCRHNAACDKVTGGCAECPDGYEGYTCEKDILSLKDIKKTIRAWLEEMFHYMSIIFMTPVMKSTIKSSNDEDWIRTYARVHPIEMEKLSLSFSLEEYSYHQFKVIRLTRTQILIGRPGYTTLDGEPSGMFFVETVCRQNQWGPHDCHSHCYCSGPFEYRNKTNGVCVSG